MYTNLNDNEINIIADNPLERAEYEMSARNDFFKELVDDENESPEKVPKRIVFDGKGPDEELDTVWKGFKQLQTLDDEPSDKLTPEKVRRLEQLHRLRLEFWTSDDAPTEGRSTPSNVVRFELEQDNPKKPKLHWNDKIMCQICGSVIRRNLSTYHLRTKKHRLAAVDLELRLASRVSNKFNDFVYNPQAKSMQRRLMKYIDAKVEAKLAQKQYPLRSISEDT